MLLKNKMYKITQVYNPLYKKNNSTLDSLSSNDKIIENNLIIAKEENDYKVKFCESNIVTNHNLYLDNSNDSWIQTYSGKKFYTINPKIEDICIEDIAHALSNICRFTGHSLEFYSVAQHSVLVSYICDQENALCGLLHDGSEAYTSDISSPIKKTAEFTEFRKIEERLQKLIYEKFNFLKDEPDDVKKADLLLLATEFRDLMKSTPHEFKIKPLPFKIIPLQPKDAKQLFLERFSELISAS